MTPIFLLLKVMEVTNQLSSKMGQNKLSIVGYGIVIFGWIGVLLAVSMPLIDMTMFRYLHGRSWFGVIWMVGIGLAITSGVILYRQGRLGSFFLWVGLISFLIGLMCPET